MNSVLSLSIVKSKSSLVCRIISMDERLRIADLNFSFQASNGFQVRSYTHPEINDNAIYLRGTWTSEDDNYFVAYPYRNTVDQLKNKALVAIKEFLKDRFGCEFDTRIDRQIVSFVEYTGYSQIYTKE